MNVKNELSIARFTFNSESKKFFVKENSMLKIALPSGKSLEVKTVKLFTDAFISIKREGESNHEVSFPDYLDISKGKFIKPRRIPKLVEEGQYDIAITGLDVVEESGADVEVCTPLNYGRNSIGKTRGVLFVHKDDEVACVEDIPPEAVILSEYPSLTERFFQRLGLYGVTIAPSSGSVEAEVPDQYRFGVCLTETGKSLRENNLKEIVTIFESQTVLIANKESLKNLDRHEAIHSLKILLLGTLEAELYLLLTMNVPLQTEGDILRLLPSVTAPTVSPLAGTVPFVSISSAIKKDKVNQLIPKLLKLGARGLLLQPMSSMIPKW